MDIAILDVDGAHLPPGTTGEICVRGPGVFAGYHNNPEATAQATRFGWFHTGDLGHMDEQGFVYITGRASDMYISGGSNVYPREIEEVLLTHPAVAEACVVGMPHEKWGESGVAVLVLAEGCGRDGGRTARASGRQAGEIQMAGAFRVLAGAAEIRLRQGRQARRETSVGGDRVMQDIAAIKDYHAHVYYDPSTKPKAAQLRQWVEERFAGQMRMGSWHDEEVGPHVQAMYQIAFPPELFPTLVPFIMMNRMGLTVLVHPQSGRPRDDHTVNAMWMGEVLPVKTERAARSGVGSGTWRVVAATDRGTFRLDRLGYARA